jgi:hypothetical protein
MKTYLENLYEHEFNKLFKIAHEIEPWYTVDKVKDYAVYIWTKNTDENFGENVFDIEADDIVFYIDHSIIPEALPTIQRIQEQLKKIEIIGKQLRKEM